MANLLSVSLQLADDADNYLPLTEPTEEDGVAMTLQVHDYDHGNTNPIVLEVTESPLTSPSHAKSQTSTV